MASYNEMDPRGKCHENDVVSWPSQEVINTVLPDATAIFERHMLQHAVLKHYYRTRDRRPVKISDFQSRSEFHRLGLYGEFYRPLGIEDMIGVNFPAPSRRVFGIALHRGRLFSERDRLVLNLVRPHLVQAYQSSQTTTLINQRLRLVSHVLETLPYGIIALTPGGRIELATAFAEQMLEAYFGPRLGARLPEELEKYVTQHRSAPAGTDGPFPLRTPYTRNREGRQLVARVVTGTTQDMLYLEERATALFPESLRHLGLTRREAEVLVLVSQGKTNPGIANALGTSPETVAKHLGHIYEKLGVGTRTAAVARALESIAGTSFHPHPQRGR